jgi:hypothetical protein
MAEYIIFQFIRVQLKIDQLQSHPGKAAFAILHLQADSEWLCSDTLSSNDLFKAGAALH